MNIIDAPVVIEVAHAGILERVNGAAVRIVCKLAQEVERWISRDREVVAARVLFEILAKPFEDARNRGAIAGRVDGEVARVVDIRAGGFVEQRFGVLRRVSAAPQMRPSGFTMGRGSGTPVRGFCLGLRREN